MSSGDLIGKQTGGWPAKKRSFDLNEANATKAPDNYSFEGAPPRSIPAPELPFDLHPVPKVITFDCYGTLVQWYEVLLHEIESTLSAHHRTDANAGQILESFSSEAKRMTAEKPHRLYKDILRSGFDTAFRQQGIEPAADEVERIANSPMTMGPHPDVPDALRRLRERYELAIFTNSDDDLISPTVKRIGVPLDYVITAEQARAYKPSRDLFEHAYRAMGVTADETIHVAMGMYWDMKARHELGFRGIWVNRRGENGNPEWLPYAEVEDVGQAANLLLPS
ncbi:2-haloalkanoic acid dehalogenase, type II [Rhizobium leguminosarum bv. trifolii WSM597]|uniref:2-haloalkanoic acid dehalogenase, type II n=1 Tax=Rhizobium leguminosarum bv. trifolii WSM597 TaxID=754764 RepID=J0H8U8_RHILT|nr:haloacid dehalogenase type II [Rhizobium leguminosarum]EJB06773.1 2-haloalkanoic acid dehalogenase, type II [Rhizobium leguminosarum bv. trifolii WSM597]